MQFIPLSFPIIAIPVVFSSYQKNRHSLIDVDLGKLYAVGHPHKQLMCKIII